MQQKFKLHQIVYMIAAGKQIKEMVVMKYAGGFMSSDTEIPVEDCEYAKADYMRQKQKQKRQAVLDQGISQRRKKSILTGIRSQRSITHHSDDEDFRSECWTYINISNECIAQNGYNMVRILLSKLFWR